MSVSGFGKLYLIPNFLAADNPDDFLPEMVRRMVHHLDHLIVENEKEARALVKRLRLSHSQQELKLWLLNEHTKPQEVSLLLEALKNSDAGIISDAGLPCVADPGAQLVALAQTKGIEVIPLPGASSLLLTLMGSGFSGQKFTFNGYLPIEKPQRAKQLKEMELLAQKGISQLFMETPYRNRQLMEDMASALRPTTLLCIGCEVSSEKGWVKTKTLQHWMKDKPDLHKRPSLFILGA